MRAAVLRHLGRNDEALREIDNLLPIWERTVGAEHRDTLTTRYLRASVLPRLARRREALREVNALLVITERQLGAEHRDTLATRGLRADILQHFGQSIEALREVDALLPISERTLGTEHPATLAARHTRVSALYDLGRLEQALREVDSLALMKGRTLSAEDQGTLATRGLRGCILHRLGRHEEALRAFDTLLPVMERTLGVEHRDTLTMRSHRASVLQQLGRIDENNTRAAQLKTGLPLPDGDVVTTDETTPMEGTLPGNRTHPAQSIVEAKREATRLRVAALRANKKNHSIGLTKTQNKKLKAIAAANDKNVQAYLEDLVASDIAANEHLVPIGEKKLLQGGLPRRVRSKQITEENTRRRSGLSKPKPA